MAELHLQYNNISYLTMTNLIVNQLNNESRQRLLLIYNNYYDEILDLAASTA